MTNYIFYSQCLDTKEYTGIDAILATLIELWIASWIVGSV